MDAAVVEKIIAKFGWNVKQGYGMTECYLATQVTSHDLLIHSDKYGSVGRPTDLSELKVVNTCWISCILQVLYLEN